jgi:membrane-bound serine protease (ClpP class)
MIDPYDGTAQVGDIGRAESLLRPAGKARFGATLVDVVSQGEYINKGARVEVIERAGNRVVVREVD